MGSDPIFIRLVFVAGPSDEQDLWRRAAGFAAVSVEVIEAETSADAMHLVAHAGVDIVLIDAEFPEPHRSAVVQAARAALTGPVVVFTAEKNSDAFGADGDGVVTKPTTLAEVHYLMDRVLRAQLPNRVLVVDDSSTTRSIVKTILAAARFPLEVDEAEEGAQALARLRTDNFDTVFLDYNMPGLNGLEALAEIKRDHPRLEVVMITATQDDAMAARARAAGAAAYLKKPFFPTDIDDVLHAYCGMRPIPIS